MAFWPFTRKAPVLAGPKVQDQALLEISQMFLHCPADPTPGSELIDPAQFNFTVGSLRVMDEYLEQVRSRTGNEH